MKAQHEKLLIATLAGLVVLSAAAFAVTPANAAGYDVNISARVANVAWWDVLNIRKWPAHYSRKVGALAPNTEVWVERCVTVENASDWCKVYADGQSGWVNSRYLAADND